MPIKNKRKGLALDFRTFNGKDGFTYLAIKTLSGSFHVFKEVEAKQAARDCGATVIGNTRQMWAELWGATAGS
jgi:hypothetical protein